MSTDQASPPWRARTRRWGRWFARAALLPLTVLAGELASADDDAGQREAFASVYANTCIKHLSNLGNLRTLLQRNARLSQVQSEGLLMGRPGDAWILPAERGFFAVAVATATPLCTVSRAGEDINATWEQFERLVSVAPPPLVARRLVHTPSTAASTPTSQAQVVTYEWSLPGASLAQVFTLVTEASPRTAGKSITVGIATITRKEPLPGLMTATGRGRAAGKGQEGDS